jgi:two-component system KDP operon response regulator KdpE
MHKKKNIVLVVDQEPQTYKILDIILDKSDFEAVECTTGRQAIQLCVSIRPDIMILNLDLPDMTSEDIIKAVREWSQMPVIIVSARKTNEDVVKGLEMGADDYVIKPFNADVLRARINASLRKSAVFETGESELTNGPLRMDLVRHQVFLGDELIAFTPKEYSLLRYFIIHCGKMLSHRDILREVWGTAHSDDTQYLRVFVGQIREKIEKFPGMPTIITTELGIGYRMEFLHDLSPHSRGVAQN